MAIEMPMKVTRNVKAKEIRVSAKCGDMFSASVVGEDGQTLFDIDGYVPAFFPGQHYGDYISLDIDLETGQITNWKKPTTQDLVQAMPEDD